MRILGVDPGYGIIGYGLIDKNGADLLPVDFGAINTPKEESVPVRLAVLDEALEKIIIKYKPDAIAVEELFFGTNITTAIKVAQARGVILLCSIKHCGLIYEYTPLQVKMALTGTGKADKKQVQYMVSAILGLKSAPKPDDAADALAVAICHANTNHYSQRILN